MLSPMPRAGRRRHRAGASALRTHGRAPVGRANGTWPVDLDEAMATLWRDAGLSD